MEKSPTPSKLLVNQRAVILMSENVVGLILILKLIESNINVVYPKFNCDVASHVVQDLEILSNRNFQSYKIEECIWVLVW